MSTLLGKGFVYYLPSGISKVRVEWKRVQVRKSAAGVLLGT